MLEVKKWENVEILGNGSMYGTSKGKQTLSFAFYYKVKGEEKQRKVVSGCSGEEIEKKVAKFLDRIDSGYIPKTHDTAKDTMTFHEVSSLWYEGGRKRRGDRKNQISYSSVESYGYSLQKKRTLQTTVQRYMTVS